MAERQRRRLLLGGLATAGLAACGDAPLVPSPAAPGAPRAPADPARRVADDQPPPPPRECRAAWVATVSNIDWPSAPGLSAAAQRAEALAILDRARAIGLNLLVLQVRPAADAIYPSALEPWTEYLSGVQGKAPGLPGDAAWDPLAFWIAEAHRRGLELHAWLNPYRARQSAARSPLAPSHIAVRRPDLVKRYGDMLWMDPGEPEAAAHTLAVVADLLRRYDIDGLHIDDYFYPYPVPQPFGTAGAELPFPDDEAYARYRLDSGALARDDWRRANVDSLVAAIHRTVRSVKPWVRFGISPFGVGRPALRPAGVTGFSQYDKLYADAEHWLAQGWLDYWAPQLYWQINREGLQFPVLLDYWAAQNPQQRHLWPGLFTSQVPRNWPGREILEQIDILRSRSAAGGHIHFSMVALMQDRDGLATLLQMGAYAEPALVPATPWLAGPAAMPPPPEPRLQARFGQLVIDTGLDTATGQATPGPALWAVWRRIGAQWRFAVLPGSERRAERMGADQLQVQAVDRLGQLSPAARWPLG